MQLRCPSVPMPRPRPRTCSATCTAIYGNHVLSGQQETSWARCSGRHQLVHQQWDEITGDSRRRLPLYLRWQRHRRNGHHEARHRLLASGWHHHDSLPPGHAGSRLNTGRTTATPVPTVPSLLPRQPLYRCGHGRNPGEYSVPKPAQLHDPSRSMPCNRLGARQVCEMRSRRRHAGGRTPFPEVLEAATEAGAA